MANKEITYKDLCSFLPESILFRFLTLSLQTIRKDLQNVGSKLEESILADIFHPLDGMNGYNYLEQCAGILNRPKNHDKALLVRYFFDLTRANLPTIHFNLPGESTGVNQSLGFGAGDSSQYQFDDVDGTRKSSYAREFRATYNIAITSVNPEEVLTLYNLVKAIFISFHEYFTSALGFRNLEIGGMDLNLPEFQDLGVTLFSRGVQVTFSYLKEVPSMLKEEVIKDLLIDQTVPFIDPNIDC